MSKSTPTMKLLLVCMGNVCRSRMAQVVTRHLARQAGLARHLQIDSAGTHAGHDGEASDPRADVVLSGRGYPLPAHRSRQITAVDFARYDLILAMDQTNLNNLLLICPPEHQHKLRLFLAQAQGLDVSDVPDPYYGDIQGFERVLDLCEAGARGLIARCQAAAR
jgi:protein-tyrosine phosphatase